MDGVHQALNSIGGTSAQDDLDACAAALIMLLRAPTRQLIEEWLDLPAPVFKGRTARQLIAEGKAKDVAQSLWMLVDGAVA